MYIEQQIFNEIKRSLPINAVELIIMDEADNILLFKRAHEPAQNHWWMPGGRVLFAETRIKAAKRLLQTECGITKFSIQKFGMFEYLVENRTDNYNQHIIATVYIVRLSEQSSVTIDGQTISYIWQKPAECLKFIKHDFLKYLIKHFSGKNSGLNPNELYKGSFHMKEVYSKDKFIRPELYNIVLKSLPVPCVDLLVINAANEILLVKRKNAPAKGKWWLPGGRIFFAERRIDTAKRKLKEECGLEADDYKEITDFEFIFNAAGEQMLHSITTLYEVKVTEQNVIIDDQSLEYSWKSPDEWLTEETDYFIKNIMENRTGNEQIRETFN